MNDKEQAIREHDWRGKKGKRGKDMNMKSCIKTFIENIKEIELG